MVTEPLPRCTCPRDPDDPDDPGEESFTCPIHGWSSDLMTEADWEYVRQALAKEEPCSHSAQQS